MHRDWDAITRRETEVLEALRERLTNAEIAERLFVSERTVESHVSSLLRKLGATDRRDLAALAKSHPASTDALPGPLELLVDPGSLAGRQGELQWLCNAWDAAASGHLRLATVAGEAGIGKSRLAAEFSATVRADGGLVLWGACLEDSDRPFEPLAMALADDVETSLSTSSVPARGMEGLVAALGLAPLPVSGGERVDATSLAVEMGMALHRYLTRRAAVVPLLLVLEDLHWAMPSTLDTLATITRMAGPARVLLLATARDTAPDCTDRLVRLLGLPASLPNAERMRLEGLSAIDVATMLRALESDADADAVHEQTDGNPLLARELARGTHRGNVGLAAMLEDRARDLERLDAAILDVAAVIGSSFDAARVAATAQVAVLDTIQALERCTLAGLVQDTPGTPGQFSFAHGLFRTVWYERIAPSRRLELHRDVALMLEARGDGRDAGELARHACMAVPLVAPATAVAHALRAADLAARSLAIDQTVRHLQRAVDVTRVHGTDEAVELDLRIKLGQACVRSGDPRGRGVLLEAADMARRLGRPDALAEIAWAMGSTGAPPAPGARDPELSSIGRDALDGLGADRTTARARLLAALSSHYSVGGDPVLGYEYSEEALAIARELDDPRTLGAVLLARRYAGGLPITPIDRLAIADELVEIGQRTGDPTFTVFGLAARVWSHRELADLAAHDRALEQFDRRLGDHPLAYARVMREISYGIRHVLRGNLGVETQEHAQRAIELEREVQFQQGTTIAQPFLMSLLLHRGELGDGLDLIQRTRGAQPEFGPAYDAVEAVALCQVGRRHEAATLLAHHLANGFDAPPNLSLTSTLALFAEVSDHLGDVAAAEALHDRLSPFAGLLADSGAAVVTDVDLSLLQTAIVAGHDDAHERALALVARCRALDTPLVLGRALLRLAVTSDRTAGTDTTPDAMVEEALAIADATGCRLISLDAQRLGVA